MYLINIQEGRIVEDEEIKDTLVAEHPYRQWLADNIVKLEELPEPANQEPGGRWRGPEQMNVGKTHFYNF